MSDASNGIPEHVAIPEKVAVIGGGRMGAGIAHAFLMAGAHVAVVERDAASAASARERVEAAIDGSVRRGAAAPAPERLIATTSWDALRGAALVVEAVPELPELKHDTLRRAEELLEPDAVLASNTSSLSIDGLAEVLKRPGGFLGMHFFNPVPASALVEVVAGQATAPSAVDLATGWVEALGKTPIVVRDSPASRPPASACCSGWRPCEWSRRASPLPRRSTPR